ncbi:MAG: diguanylate cyclase domain-containing protein [Cellvibrionaceae bacterium]
MGKASKSTTVLLVDDDRQEYLLIGYLLAEAHHEDYRLVWCKNLEDALNHIERQTCDVVLLDYHWGGSSIGRDFLNKAKAKNSHIPIIVMTDEVEADVDEYAIREGASDYLTKSRINSQFLERAIRYAIERKQIEDRLDHLAHYDHLTDLPNRMLFLDRLRHSISIAQREKNQFTLMFIDMDDFKGVNDSYGHEVGDKLLKQFSGRLSRAVRRSDTVARIGGDEFTVLLHNIGSAPKIMMLAQKIINETNQPYTINGHEFMVGCSIGIAVYPDAGDDEETLQRNADLAMYQAKQESVSSYRFFSDVLSSDIKVQWDLHRDFYPAMAAKQFGVFYVPRVDIKSNQITAIEIAPYWKHPEKGVLHYQHFSSISADREMGKRLFEWLCAVGLHQFSKLQYAENVKLVFNLDFHHFTQGQLIQSIEKLLKKYNVSGERIEIDLNQVSIDSNIDVIESCMDALQALGIHFGINGFGSELSSLLHLQRLPINTLKIDKRLVKAVHKNAEDAQLLKAVIEFSHRIGKKVVAESIQTKAQLAMLEKLGCDQCKGQAAIGILSFKQLQHALKKHAVQKQSV